MMTNALKKYYLEQMGIVTWERRTIAPLRHDVSADLSPQSTLMIVVDECVDAVELAQWWRSKSGILLKKMLLSIGLLESAAIVIFESISDNAMLMLKSKLESNQTKLILILSKHDGLAEEDERLANLSAWFLQNYPTISVLFSVHPEDLLISPFKKKKAFNDFTWIQSQLLL